MKRPLSLTLRKLCLLFDGRIALAPLVILALCACFIAVSAASSAVRSDKLRLMITGDRQSELASGFAEELSACEGFDAERVSNEEAVYALASGRADALLSIDPGFDEGLYSGSGGLITIVTAPGSVSAEAVRETAAGKLLALRSRLQVVAELEKEGISTVDFERFMAEFDVPKLYRIEYSDGTSAENAVFGQGFACYEGFAGMALMLIMLTLSKRLSSREADLVLTRLRVLLSGGGLGFVTDAFALFLTGLACAAPAFAFAPRHSPEFAVSLICYCVLMTGLCLLIGAASSGGRMDIASPAVALITSILGGCFADMGALSPALLVLSRLTPQGQLTAAVRGEPVFIAVLAAEAAALMILAAVIRRLRASRGIVK